MNKAIADRAIIHDKKQSRFILPLEGRMEAFVDYTLSDGVMYLVHSQVPHELRGQGIGRELVEKTFQHIHAHGEEAKAVCSYIRMVAERSEKWREIVQ